MKIEVKNSTKIQLDWLVAKCLGFNAEALVQLAKKAPGKNYGCFLTKYSTDWSQGGPIIEREGISIIKQTAQRWVAEYSLGCDRTDHARVWGATPLIAAMRCFVVSKLGESVEVPNELLN
jgi:hypothetical protein